MRHINVMSVHVFLQFIFTTKTVHSTCLLNNRAEQTAKPLNYILFRYSCSIKILCHMEIFYLAHLMLSRNDSVLQLLYSKSGGCITEPLLAHTHATDESVHFCIFKIHPEAVKPTRSQVY